MNELHPEDSLDFQDIPPESDLTPENSQLPEGWRETIQYFKEQLIDTSKRNRLINSPIGKDRGKHLDIIDERSDEVFKLLVHKRRKMQFGHSEDGYDGPEITEKVFVPDPDPPSAKHVDLKLQTRLTKEALHKRLLQLYRDSNSSIEEQGFNPLFLALGFVCWYESSSSELERFAPLVLLPAELIREGVKGNFKLILRDEDLEPNHSFAAFLKNDFDLKLPPWPEGEDWLPSEYFWQVNDLVGERKNWIVYADTIQLGFYSSGKFLMSRDLDKAKRTELLDQLFEGFENDSPLFDPNENLDDRYVNPQDLGHIMEADTSQTRVIAAARDGHNMVVQGPPGTGKSQTIANIIAVSVRDNQKVLFVAEKRAALDVVYDRLKSCGLGPLCLNMHSTKAQKKAVYTDLGDTLNLGRPVIGDRSEYEHLKAVRDELNELSKQLHAVDEVNGETPYKIIGQLAKLIGEKDLPRPDYHMEEMATWVPKKAQKARREVERLAVLTREYGPEGSHTWRGANRKLTPMDRDRLNDMVRRLQKSLGELQICLREACTALSLHDTEGGLSFVEKIVSLTQAMGTKPNDVDRLMRVEGVVEYAGKLQALFEDIRESQTTRAELEASVKPEAFNQDWSSDHREITKHKTSFLRWFRRSYRTAIKRVKTVAKDAPKSNIDRLRLLDTLIRHRAQVQEIEERRILGELVVGPLWRGFKTDVTGVLESVQWINAQIELLESPDAFKVQMNQWPKSADPDELAGRLRDCAQMVEQGWDDVMRICEINVQQAFAEESIRNVPLAMIIDRMALWEKNPETQEDWIRLYDTAKVVSERGLHDIRNSLADGNLAPEHACGTYDYVRAEAIYHRFTELNPNLSKISGRERSALVEKFMELDSALLNLSAKEVMSAHYEAIPLGARGKMGVLRGEAQKKTRHMALRRLLKEVGDAVQTIKPVFLMSPLSVAQYLDPDGLEFDLLLIDEASQVRPADAIGAMMRAKRAIIVGDQKQLPPTSFFEKLVNNEEDTEDTKVRPLKDMESILALCEARCMPGTGKSKSDCMLKWHYRSQHESLIAVSNQEFYKNELVFPPSPAALSTNVGLTFEFVDGVYRRGRGKSDNPDEAKAVMNAVLEHARNRPSESLGVVAMSQAQQVTIQNEAERLRAKYPELNSFCSETKENPFFVKNLETVQGDERDVILISIGYGKTEGGQLFQNFGPVSNEGGERRLNVLFTRAKKRCHVFASIRHTDIRHDKARHRGPQVLKTFLRYAETGEMDVPVITGKEPDSPFEEAVGNALRGYGYEVDYQVGSDGFLIDLAVRDPDSEGGYVLAIECDGARYHSSCSARERDRMRQTLLEGKGWTFHRIWSTDWFNNPETETKKAVEAIRRACAKTDRNLPPVHRRPPVERESKPKQPPESSEVFYKEFKNRNGDKYVGNTYYNITDAQDKTIAALIAEIVEVEGPVHEEVVARKTRIIWGYDQAGKRIKDEISQAVQFAVRKGMVERCDLDKSFLKKPSTQIHVRDRSKLKRDSLLRKPEMISPREYRLAILDAVRRCVGIDKEECAVESARMFGFKSTGSTFKKQVMAQIELLSHEGHLILQPNGIMKLCDN